MLQSFHEFTPTRLLPLHRNVSGLCDTTFATAKIGPIVTLSLQSLSAEYRQHTLSFQPSRKLTQLVLANSNSKDRI